MINLTDKMINQTKFLPDDMKTFTFKEISDLWELYNSKTVLRQLVRGKWEFE